MKTCLCCGVTKDICEFKTQFKQPDGRIKVDAHMDICHTCDRERTLKFIEENSDYVGTGKRDDNESISMM